jgi:hypothetical protein
MKKIKLKLSKDEMECFVSVLLQFSKRFPSTQLLGVTLLQLYWRLRHRVPANQRTKRSVQLSVAEGIALCMVIAHTPPEAYEPYTLSVITELYKNVHQQIYNL